MTTWATPRSVITRSARGVSSTRGPRSSIPRRLRVRCSPRISGGASYRARRRVAPRSTSSACFRTETCIHTSTISSRSFPPAAATACAASACTYARRRDVPETSALTYVDRLGSSGRLRARRIRLPHRVRRRPYGHHYGPLRSRLEHRPEGLEAHVLGLARKFNSTREAIETFRAEDPELKTSTFPHSPSRTTPERRSAGDGRRFGHPLHFQVIAQYSCPAPSMMRFRTVRSRTAVLTSFSRDDGVRRRPEIPRNYLVRPPSIDHPISEYLALAGCRQYAVSETQVRPVTYFWNGNRSGRFDDKIETYEEIPSTGNGSIAPVDEGGRNYGLVLRALNENSYDFLRLNFANGDMVGHTGVFSLVGHLARKRLTLCIARLLPAVAAQGGCALITADHGISTRCTSSRRTDR